MARITLSTRMDSVEARLDGMESALARIEAALTAKPSTPRRVAAAKPKASTKGQSSVGSITPKEWNRTLTAKARFAGGDAYKTVLAAWDRVQTLRAQGYSPDAALVAIVG